MVMIRVIQVNAVNVLLMNESEVTLYECIYRVMSLKWMMLNKDGVECVDLETR